MSWGLLYDSTLCIGCGGCTAACKEQNNLPLPVEEKMTAYTWTVVNKHGDAYQRRLCMHCHEPTCASVCPVGAMKKTDSGAVYYEAKLCIGCRYCIQACPFGVPKYQWDSAVPIVGKCILCRPRIESGQATACATVCPTGATVFGEREAMLETARERLRSEPTRYVSHVYGEHEAGGTSVLMLAGVPFGQLGLPENLPQEALPLLTWRVLSKLPDIVMVAAVLLYGIHWITKRRADVHAAEGGGPEPPMARGSGRIRS